MGQINNLKNIIVEKFHFNKEVDINNSEYKSLNPINDLPIDNEHIKALHFGINDKAIKNIALTGPYGSGKSSIINSYIKNYPKEKAINISLANFNSNNQSVKKENEISNENEINTENKEDNVEDINNYLELAILKQFFYKVKSKDIPQSRFKKIEKVNLKNIYFICLSIFICLILFFSFFFLDKTLFLAIKFKIYAKYNLLPINLVYSLFIAFILLLLYFVSKIVQIIITHYKVKEISINKISISSNDKDNVFDKTLDEILYFFQETKYQIVFFEDLDRFNDTKIFIRLRELNTLINNYELIENKVVFVYAIRDELFIDDEERTKFFDFIIPVIPFVNSTNSDEKLKERLAKEKDKDGLIISLKYDLSDKYINLISPFIQNMRILMNVYNEFMIYKNTLKNIQLDDEKLFSLILFKNLYPKDFSDLENEKGIIKQAFIDKRMFINNRKKEIIENKNKLQEKLNNINQDILMDIREIKSAMLAYLSDYNGFQECRCYSNFYRHDYCFNEIMRDDFDLETFIKENKSIDVTCCKNRVDPIDNLEEKLNQSGRHYLERIAYLKDSTEDRKKEILKEIDKYNNEENELNSYSLEYLLNCNDGEQVLSDDVRKNGLLFFLLKNGYINENYTDYINYFHPNSVTVDEMKFIQNVRTENYSGNFGYPIKNVVQVCKRIEDYEFKNKEALNYNIVDHLIKNENNKKCKYLFAGFINEDDAHINFIEQYINRGENLDLFIKLLSQYYDNFWHMFSNRNDLSKETKDSYFLLINKYASIESMQKMNIDNCIVNYYFNNRDILLILEDVLNQKLISIIEELDIKFKDVSFENINLELVDYIFKTQHYLLNENMITEYFKIKYPDQVNNLTNRNYTTILDSKDEYLISCIENNKKFYVENIILKIESNTYETKETVKSIIDSLFNDNIDLCMQVLEKEHLKWDSFDECFSLNNNNKNICLKFWNVLLENNKINETWNNFVCYYKYFSFTDELISWLGQKIDLLIDNYAIDDFSNSTVLKKLLIYDELDDNIFDKLIHNYRIDEFDFDLNLFSNTKLKMLIDINYIPLTINYFEQIKSIDENYSIEYLINQKNGFLKDIESFDLNIQEIINLLKSKRFSDDEMLEIIYVLDESDINSDIAHIIRNIQIPIKKSYVNQAWKLLDKDEKYALFLNQIDIFTNEEISLKLYDLDGVYKQLSDNSKRHMVKLYNDQVGYNKRLVRKLVEKKYLSSFNEDGEYLIARVRKLVKENS